MPKTGNKKPSDSDTRKSVKLNKQFLSMSQNISQNVSLTGLKNSPEHMIGKACPTAPAWPWQNKQPQPLMIPTANPQNPATYALIHGQSCDSCKADFNVKNPQVISPLLFFHILYVNPRCLSQTQRFNIHSTHVSCSMNLFLEVRYCGKIVVIVRLLFP